MKAIVDKLESPLPGATARHERSMFELLEMQKKFTSPIKKLPVVNLNSQHSNNEQILKWNTKGKHGKKQLPLKSTKAEGTEKPKAITKGVEKYITSIVAPKEVVPLPGLEALDRSRTTSQI